MPFPALLATIAVATVVFSAVVTRLLIPALRREGVVAQPNERSLHSTPTPVGGGLAPVGAIVLAWIVLGFAGRLPPLELLIPLGAMLLAVISWFDDRAGVPACSRLVVQIIVVAVTLALGSLGGPLFHGFLPPLGDGVVTALIWIWFLNLYNFMDGADGLAAGEAVAIGVGLTVVTTIGAALSPAIAVLAVAIAGAAIGFLFWNWAPARVFLGDVGSVPFGYLIGFLLLRLAVLGWWKAALILPLYFLADATLTLFRRALRGARIWQAHREHFYQRAVLAGRSHATVVSAVLVADVALIACAWGAENGLGRAGLVIAALVVAMLLAVLARPGYTGADDRRL